MQRAVVLNLGILRPLSHRSILRAKSPPGLMHQHILHAIAPATQHRPAVCPDSTLQLPVPDNVFHDSLREINALSPQQQRRLYRHLRSDYAGEVGAVWIYKGAQFALSYIRSKTAPSAAVEFVNEHAETERGHLAFFTLLLPWYRKSILAPLWRVAGFLLGFLPTAFGGPRGLFLTVHAVESFVEIHYLAHIDPLRNMAADNPCPTLTTALLQFCSDEVLHADDAAEHSGVEQIVVNKLPCYEWVWYQVVWHASASAAALARWV